MTDTKSRLLDAAERLFAEHGPEVSLRSITGAAEVNLAAVNYHFQSKDALLDAMIARRLGPMNERRLELLDALEAEVPAGPLPLERVLEAFLVPVDQTPEFGEHLRPLLGRLFTLPQPAQLRMFERHLRPVQLRFIAAFQRALPDVPPVEILWRLFFSIGAMLHVMGLANVLPMISGGVIDISDRRAITQRIVAFTAAGFRGQI